MSYYSSFLFDLPKRTRILIERHCEIEALNSPSYEVTLLLSLACPLVVSNSESIKQGYDTDGLRIPETILQDVNSTIQNLNSDCLKILARVSMNWLCGNIKNNDVPFNEIEMRHFINFNPLRQSNKHFLTILKEVRNALSHAGVKYFSDIEGNIEYIIFRSLITMSDISKGFNYHVMPVSDFKAFLIGWCKFLEQNNDKNILEAVWINQEYDYYRTGTDS